MNRHDSLQRRRTAHVSNAARSWTLLELLTAMAVGGIVLSGVALTFIQVLRASHRAERIIEATENARAAAETIAYFVKAARIEPTLPYQYFQGLNVPTPAGDRIDNDGDDVIDEEQPDGLDDDGDWVADRDERHVQIGNTVERRRLWRVRADLGDDRVDEDCVFHRDQLSLAIFAEPSLPGSRDEITSFSISAWEGEDNVLIMRALRDVGSGNAAPTVEPLAWNVLSLNFLYWDPNQALPYWTETWDAMTTATRPSPAIELPATVLISVTIYAGRAPLDQLSPTDPIETVTVNTMVNLEAVIHDPRYELVVRPRL